MPRTSCDLSCESDVEAPGVTTICFPKDEKKKNLWIHSTNTENLVPSGNSTVCASHFRKNLIISNQQKTKLACNENPLVFSKRFCSQNPTENKNISHAEEQHSMVGAGSGWSSAKDKIGATDRTQQMIFIEDTDISQGCSTLVQRDECGVGTGGALERRLSSAASGPVRPVAASYLFLLDPMQPSPLPYSERKKTTVIMGLFENRVAPHQVNQTKKYVPVEDEFVNEYVIKNEPDTRVDGIPIAPKPIVEERVVTISCCVFGCFSNLRAPLVTMFPFPDDESQRNLWLKCIGREDYVPTKFSAVCIHHFREEFIVRTMRYRRKNGMFVVSPLNKPRLAPDAIPSLFIRSSQKSSFNVRPPPDPQSRIRSPRRMDEKLDLHEEYMVKEENIAQEAWVNNVKEEIEEEETWFSNNSDDAIVLSPISVKEENDDDEVFILP